MTHMIRRQMSPERKFRLARTIIVGSVLALTGFIAWSDTDEAVQKPAAVRDQVEELAQGNAHELRPRTGQKMVRAMGQLAGSRIGIESHLRRDCDATAKNCEVRVSGTYSVESAADFTASVDRVFTAQPFAMRASEAIDPDGLSYDAASVKQHDGLQVTWGVHTECSVGGVDTYASQAGSCDVSLTWQSRALTPTG